MQIHEQIKGCLLAGAAGDALGYEVEFSSEESIFGRYGSSGITTPALKNGAAQISDDTQMTLFTACGLLQAAVRCTSSDQPDYIGCIADCYRDWLLTQQSLFPLDDENIHCWLMTMEDLFNRRAPGMTCISAIGSGINGTIESPINQSKGCGGIMRIAPIPLLLYKQPAEFVCRLAAEASALTHGHELGYIPSAALAYLIWRALQDDACTLREAAEDMLRVIPPLFPDAYHMKVFHALMTEAIVLSELPGSDLDAIHELGEGWVAEETLAISLYCALRYYDDPERALIASVNHKGDSDSTGAVTGNLIGAFLGIDAIPAHFLEHLELNDVLLTTADDLYCCAAGISDEWKIRY